MIVYIIYPFSVSVGVKVTLAGPTMPKQRKPALGFDIIGPGGGAAVEFDGEYGRSIRFKDGTPYTIEITNSGGYYAVSIKIDGAWVTRTPMIVYPKGRKVPGFTAKTTSSRETNDDGTAPGSLPDREGNPPVRGLQAGDSRRCRQCQFRPDRVLLLPDSVGEEYRARPQDEEPAAGWARRRARGRAHDRGRRTADRPRLASGPAQHTGRGHARAAVPRLQDHGLRAGVKWGLRQ